MAQNILEVKNLKKTYKRGKTKIDALKGISFTVPKGEIFGILGVNGAGKSTTLNILIGLLTPTTGTVKIFGKNISQYEQQIKERMNIATAYADLPGNLTIFQNLKIYALMYGVTDPHAQIDRLLSQFGMTEYRNRRFYQLSAGQKTRINLCKALINDPELLLLDEPTASLDPSIAAHTREMLLGLQRKRKLTIILTSHNMPEVEEMCDRVALLHKGEIYRTDTPENLINFLKVPSMEDVFIKLAKGELEEDEPR